MTSPTWRALGQVVLVYFAVGGAAVTAQDTQPGRATFAEMIAFARLASVPCAFRKSYPNVMVVQARQDWDGYNDPGPLHCPT
jgi:hypothetical protein